jgi:hypothetical protein
MRGIGYNHDQQNKHTIYRIFLTKIFVSKALAKKNVMTKEKVISTTLD